MSPQASRAGLRVFTAPDRTRAVRTGSVGQHLVQARPLSSMQGVGVGEAVARLKRVTVERPRAYRHLTGSLKSWWLDSPQYDQSRARNFLRVPA